MHWTKELPTQPGYYWTEDFAGCVEPVVLAEYLGETRVYLLGIEGEGFLDDYVRWYGPITPPPFIEPCYHLHTDDAFRCLDCGEVGEPT